MITRIKQQIRRVKDSFVRGYYKVKSVLTWQRVAATVAIPMAFAAGEAMTDPVVIQGDTITELQNRGLDVRIQVLVKEPNFQDAIYYTPETLADKLSKKSYDELTVEIMAESKQRVDNHKALIEANSQQVAPINEPEIEQP